MNHFRLSTLTILILMLAPFGDQAQAQPAKSNSPAFDEKAVADFYRGKTIRIVIGSGPGGPTISTRASSRVTCRDLFPAILLCWFSPGRAPAA